MPPIPFAPPVVRLGLFAAALASSFVVAPASAETPLSRSALDTTVFGAINQYTPPVYDILPNSYPCWSPIATPYQPLSDKVGSVPLPCYFTPSAGTDGEAVVVDKIHGTLRVFEGWNLAFKNQWTMQWGGYEPETAFDKTPWGWVWPVSAAHYGVQASGFAFLPGLITVMDLALGKIDHAIHVTVPRACDTWVPPATRTDGNAAPTGTENCHQYGTAYKLPDSFTIPAHWPRVVKMIATAARDHGLVITDQNLYGVGFRFENYQRPWAWWSPDGSVVDPYRDPAYANLNFFECPTATSWSCFPDRNHLFQSLFEVEAPNTRNFWDALVQVNPE
ncbi:MAG: hypothetical protein QM674_15800 [Burkholderiaceae bacterium]